MINLDTILLVEDNLDDFELIRYAFAKVGIANPMVNVQDGDEAIAFLSGKDAYLDRAKYPLPSLVLLDLKLPKRSGFDVLRFIRGESATKHTPVVVLTSSDQREDIKRAYELGANSYLVKPAGRERLIGMVRAVNDYWLKFNQAARS